MTCCRSRLWNSGRECGFRVSVQSVQQPSELRTHSQRGLTFNTVAEQLPFLYTIGDHVSEQITSTNPEQRRNLTGLFLGAGASYDLGMPLVWELTDELKRWLTSEKLRTLNQHWRSTGLSSGYPNTAIENLNSVLRRKEMHYENILGYLQTQSRRDPRSTAGLSWLVFVSVSHYLWNPTAASPS